MTNQGTPRDPESQVPKNLRRRLLSAWPARRPVELVDRLTPRREGRLTVVMFHRTLDPGRFEDQLEALLDGRVAVSGSQVIAALDGEDPLPRGAVWLTFDDAYGDYIDHAFPVLRSRGLPSTQFVPTEFVGSRPAAFWWERLGNAFQRTPRRDPLTVGHGAGSLQLDLSTPAIRRASLKRAREEVKARSHEDGMDLVARLEAELGPVDTNAEVRVMTWDELKELHAAGVEFGGHTHAHPMLNRIPSGAIVKEIRAGFDELEKHLPTVLPVLAYPAGQYDHRVLAAVQEAGVRTAVTTNPGVHRLGRDSRLEIQRVSIGPYADGTAARLRLALASLPFRRTASRRGSPGQGD